MTTGVSQNRETVKWGVSLWLLLKINRKGVSHCENSLTIILSNSGDLRLPGSQRLWRWRWWCRETQRVTGKNGELKDPSGEGCRGGGGGWDGWLFLGRKVLDGVVWFPDRFLWGVPIACCLLSLTRTHGKKLPECLRIL